jgi:hypothetical protein
LFLDVPPGDGEADPDPEPGRELRVRLAFPQVTSTSIACCPPFSFRHRDPIAGRCRRMIPAT